jgi:hypothetical protein
MLLEELLRPPSLWLGAECSRKRRGDSGGKGEETLGEGANSNKATVNFSVDFSAYAKLGFTVRLGGIGTGISEASKRVPIFSFATQGGSKRL